MDCEKFDRIVLDLLYQELDELSGAAAERHMQHCTRCSGIAARLRATRQVGVVPMVDPPEGLETRILDAERVAHAALPLRRRVGRAISILAGYSMRPQLGMAALFLLMIGASLVFLRATPGDRDRITVTEHGVPESESESVAIIPTPEKLPEPSLAADRSGAAERDESKDDPKLAGSEPPNGRSESGEGRSDAGPGDAGGGDYALAMEAFRAGRYAEAEERFTEIAARGGDNGPSAALFAAQAARSSSGCSSAGGRFDEVHTRYRGTSVGNEAAWQAAVCYSALGQTERARKNYEAVLNADGYGERAAKAIASLDRQASPEAASGANAAVEARAKASATAPKTEAQKTGTPKNAAPVQAKPPAEKKAASEDTRQAEPDPPALSQ